MENPQTSGGHPVPMAGEMFVLSRRGLAFTASSGSRKFQAGGQLFLSPLRIVFVARDLPSRGGGFPRADPSPPRAAQAEESSGSGLLGTLFGASKANVLAFDLPLATLERERASTSPSLAQTTSRASALRSRARPATEPTFTGASPSKTAASAPSSPSFSACSPRCAHASRLSGVVRPVRRPAGPQTCRRHSQSRCLRRRWPRW